MAIRPVDIQGAIFQSTQVAQTQRQAELAPQTAQVVAAQQFSDKIEDRNETVQHMEHGEGNRVRERGDEPGAQGRKNPRRQRLPGEPLDALEDSVLGGVTDGEHLVDFTA